MKQTLIALTMILLMLAASSNAFDLMFDFIIKAAR